VSSLITWSGRTDVGRFRQENQDAFLAQQLVRPQANLLGKDGEALLEAGDYIFAVSDGLGGEAGGDYASREAMGATADFFARGLDAALATQAEARETLLVDWTTQLHRRISFLGDTYEETRYMGATFTLVWLRGHRMVFCHLGDSRLYCLAASGEMRQLSEDHSHVGWLRRTGQLTEYQARTHPQRNQIDRCLGAHQHQVHPQTGSCTLSPGDTLLLCSDGLNDGLSDNGIVRLLHEPPVRVAEEPPAARLISEARAQSGRDNLTAVVVMLSA